MSRPVSLLSAVLAVALADLRPAVATPAANPAPAATPGLAFAVALRGTGEALASGPYLLRVPGGTGPLRLELTSLAVEGARLRGQARLRNESSLLVAGLALDFESASATRQEASERSAVLPLPVKLREPLVFGDLLPGESTPRIPFDLSPIPEGGDIVLTTLLGAVSGLALESPAAVAGAVRPVALDTDRYGRLYVACADVGRILRLATSSASTPEETAHPKSPPAGIAVRRRNGDLIVSTEGSVIEVFRPGRKKPATLDVERPVKTIRVDGKDVLRAASGNSVLAFEEAKPGRGLALGPEGSEVISFDAGASGVIHAVLREGDSTRLVTAGPTGAGPYSASRGPGSDVVDAPAVCRLDAEGSLWVAGRPRTFEGTLLARFGPDGTPRNALSRSALALLLGKAEDAAVPGVVDAAQGPERRVYVLLETGVVFAVRPF